MNEDFWMGVAIGSAVGMLGTLLSVWVMHVCMLNTLREFASDGTHENI